MTQRKGETTPTPKFKQDKKPTVPGRGGYGLKQRKPNLIKKTEPGKENEPEQTGCQREKKKENQRESPRDNGQTET